jgi:hypothetical protein
MTPSELNRATQQYTKLRKQLDLLEEKLKAHVLATEKPIALNGVTVGYKIPTPETDWPLALKLIKGAYNLSDETVEVCLKEHTIPRVETANAVKDLIKKRGWKADRAWGVVRKAQTAKAPVITFSVE